MKTTIIGGGIAGLTTALALQKVGISSSVYERAENLNEIGAGVWLQPNAIQVLKWLGLYGELYKEGCVLNKMEITYPDLTPIKKIKKSVVSDKYGNQTIAIHRWKLQKILYNECAKYGNVELGMTYQSHEKVDNKINVQFTDKTIQTDILIGADGIHSNVRSSMGLPSEYRSSGQICCRGIAKIGLPEYLQNEGKEIWGHKLRFGFSQISENDVYFFIVMNKEIQPSKITKEALTSLYKNFDPVVAKIINASGEMHITELTDLKRLPTWHRDNSCLIGDAAHATTPNMGQGACQGIEDAYYLSKYLHEEINSSDAFQAFETQRRKKADYVVNNSWNFGKMVHSGIGQLFLTGIMKITPESVMSKQMNRLYSVEGL